MWKSEANSNADSDFNSYADSDTNTGLFLYTDPDTYSDANTQSSETGLKGTSSKNRQGAEPNRGKLRPS